MNASEWAYEDFSDRLGHGEQEDDDMEEHRLADIQAWLDGATAKELRFLATKLRTACDRVANEAELTAREAKETLRVLAGQESAKAPRAPRSDKGTHRKSPAAVAVANEQGEVGF